jgi:CDP-glucose 4,6-dehydratase
MAISKTYWKNRKVLITGHTGFKGSWMVLILKSLGAKVYGVALENNEIDSLYQTARVSQALTKEFFVDITDSEQLNNCVKEVNPETIFHLAAESLVLKSYEDPVKTFQVNIIGTFNLLWSATKALNNPTIIVVTSDKCYRNDGSGVPFQEDDPLGGSDPYSASKACAEIISSSFHYAFGETRQMKIGTVRAGNVIGGGDWSENRLVPDFFKSIRASKQLMVRSPDATRPWQHVLEPLIGYLAAAEYLDSRAPEPMNSWNFGPTAENVLSVENVLNRLLALHPTAQITLSREKQNKEAHFLNLDSSRAIEQLGWEQILGIDAAIMLTSQWYSQFFEKQDMQLATEVQIKNYLNLVFAVD